MTEPEPLPTTDSQAANYWVSRLHQSTRKSIDAILINARVVFEAEAALAHEQREVFRQTCGLNPSDLSKLKTIGEHAAELRKYSETLPPSTSTLYLLARNVSRLPDLLKLPLRSMSRREIAKCVAPARRSTNPLAVIRVVANENSPDEYCRDMARKLLAYAKEIDTQSVLMCSSPYSPAEDFSPVKKDAVHPRPQALS